MAEYVCELPVEGMASFVSGGTTIPVLERIVRCMACKHYTPESMYREERGFGVYETVCEPGGCFNPERCSVEWDPIKEDMVPVGIVTKPDGFCAWGVRREEA